MGNPRYSVWICDPDGRDFRAPVQEEIGSLFHAVEVARSFLGRPDGDITLRSGSVLAKVFSVSCYDQIGYGAEVFVGLLTGNRFCRIVRSDPPVLTEPVE